MPALLEVEGLSKSFSGLRAAHNLTFSVGRGEIAALIGPNGAGKTTCFNMIAGVYRPDAGRVHLDGRRIDGLRPDHLACYGAELDAMPSLTALAAESVVFEDHLAVCTGLNAGLASLCTGLHAREHGVGSLRDRGQQALAPSRTTLAERLRDTGWRTVAVLSSPQLAPALSGLGQGFEHVLTPGLF